MTAFRPVREAIPLPEERFRSLYSSHYPPVYGYAARRLGADEATDAAAEVFTVAWRKLSSVPEEPDTLPWLYGVARHVVANARRSQRRRDRLHARAAAAYRPSCPDPEPFDAAAALEVLSDDDAELLRLAAWEGLGPEDLGAVLGCTANTAAVRLHRARRRLEDVLSEAGGAS